MSERKAVKAFQDYFPDNKCFGCGPANPNGLQIKSYWFAEDDDRTVCAWQPKDFCSSRDVKIMHGGNIASLIDCHSIWTAIAWRYRLENREIGIKPDIVYVTANLNINFFKPVPVDPSSRLLIVSRIAKNKVTDKKFEVLSSLFVNNSGEEFVLGKVIAVRVEKCCSIADCRHSICC